MKLNAELPKKREFLGDASPWKRGLAFITDLIIIDFVVGTPLSERISGAVPTSGSPMDSYNFFMANPDAASTAMAVFFAMGFLAFAYFVLFEYLLEQTPGKMLSRLYVKNEEKKLKLTFFQCILRNLFLLPVFPFFLLWVIDPIFIFMKKQRLSDIIAKTKVVEVYTL